ncbi:MAG: hypothetical protein JST84_04710 [Acidobacteria bacterium]|nr:hypothetical protein [Acidobacteriota bacterium]
METLLDILFILGVAVIIFIFAVLRVIGVIYLLSSPVYTIEKGAGPAARPPTPKPNQPHPADHQEKHS